MKNTQYLDNNINNDNNNNLNSNKDEIKSEDSIYHKSEVSNEENSEENNKNQSIKFNKEMNKVFDSNYDPEFEENKLKSKIQEEQKASKLANDLIDDIFSSKIIKIITNYYTEDIDQLINNLNESNYKENISKNITNNFDIKKEIDKKEILTGIFPKIIFCYNNNDNNNNNNNFDIIGLCLYHFNENNEIIINHLSVKNDEEKIEEFKIEKMIDKIISNEKNYENIIINLKENYDKNNIIIKTLEKKHFSIDEQNKILLYKNLGFLETEKNSTKNIMILNDLLLFSLKNINEIDNNDNINLIDYYFNIFPIIFMLSKLEQEENKINLSTLTKNSKTIFYLKVNNLFEKINLNVNINFDNNDNNFILPNTKENTFDLNEKFCEENINSFFINFITKINNNFYLTCVIDNFYYNVINCKEININENDYGKIYEIKLENKFYLFLFEITNEKTKSKLFEKNLSEEFFEIYNNNKNNNVIENSDFITPIDDINLCIPVFNINSHLFSNKIKYFEKNLKITDSNENVFNINNVDEFIEFNVMEDFNKENGFKVNFDESEKNNIIIKNNFIIGIGNKQISHEHLIPAINLFYITKDMWQMKY